jgi:hypothetical protein
MFLFGCDKASEHTPTLLGVDVVFPAFSRAALAQSILRRNACPTCNADLGNWDVAAAPRNVVLAGLVDGLGTSMPVPCCVCAHVLDAKEQRERHPRPLLHRRTIGVAVLVLHRARSTNCSCD